MYKILLLLLASSSLLACNMIEKTKKYPYVVTDSAPENYPCEIYRGSLHYGKTKGVPVPRGKFIDYGWGRGSTHYGSRAPKELPHQLDIAWLSYRENKFYGGSFELPKAKMEALFDKGFAHTRIENTKDTYSKIIVGVAPGGIVSVWLMGAGHQVQIGVFKGEETEIDWAAFNPSGIKDRDLYVNGRLNRHVSADELAKPVPFGLWETYALRYLWKPVVVGKDVNFVIQTLTEFFSGEREMFVREETKEFKYASKTIPKKAEIWWQSKDHKQYKTKVFFNEKEMYRLFEQLARDTENDKIEVIFKHENKVKVSVWLKTKEQEVLLENAETKTFKSNI